MSRLDWVASITLLIGGLLAITLGVKLGNVWLLAGYIVGGMALRSGFRIIDERDKP